MNSTIATTLLIAVVLVAVVQGFTPSSLQGGRGETSTQLNKSIFDAISDMDLWAPDKDSNSYGARNNKKVSLKFTNVTFSRSYYYH